MFRALLAATVLYASAGYAGNVVVSPQPIADLLANPGMGIESSGQQSWPRSTIASRRWYWAVLEPQRGLPRWDLIADALAQAHDRGQTLAIRLRPYDAEHPLPQWCIPSGREPASGDASLWKHWRDFVAELGRRFDGHPDLDTVDIPSIPMPADSPERKPLMDLWFAAFPGMRLLANSKDPEAASEAVAREAGWRFDDLGNVGSQAAAMLDAGVSEAWRRSPVHLETYRTPAYWKQQGWDAGKILDQGLRWHVTALEIPAGAIPSEFAPAFADFERRMGYRLELRRMEYPASVSAGSRMPIQMRWVNAGVAPVYRPYAPALEFAFSGSRYMVDLPVDVRAWLPGETTVEQEIRLPPMPPGDYRLRLALLDPITNQPAVRLAIAGRLPNGWYDLGAISVQ
jgi:hypothetical protein